MIRRDAQGYELPPTDDDIRGMLSKERVDEMCANGRAAYLGEKHTDESAIVDDRSGGAIPTQLLDRLRSEGADIPALREERAREEMSRLDAEKEQATIAALLSAPSLPALPTLDGAKKRGRPKGSKNATNDSSEESDED